MTLPTTRAPTTDRGAASPGQRPRRDYVLPKIPALHADESLPGFLMRAAERFRFHDPRRLLRRLALPNQILATLCRADPTDEQGRRIRIALGLDEAAFGRMTLWTGDPTMVSVMGTPVWRELVRPERRSVCPLCLEESRHHRAVWMVHAMPVCTRHSVLLIDRCPAPGCRRKLEWVGDGVHRCGSSRCRFDLRRAKPSTVDGQSLGGISALERMLHSASPPEGIPSGLPFGPALKLAMTFGKMADGVERRGRPPGFIEREMARMPMIMDAGWGALDDWPRGFDRLLDLLRTRAGGRAGRDGLRKAFGPLSKLVHEWAREPWGEPIGAAFAEYAARQPDLATTSHTISRYSPSTEIRQMHLSISQAQELLGIGPASMQRIAERRDMYVLPPRGAGTPSLMRADIVEAAKQELEGCLLIEEAQAILGVGQGVMVQMEPSGLLVRIEPQLRIMESRVFLRSDVEALVSACVGSPPEMSLAAAKSVGLTKLVRATGPGRSVPDICKALVAGRLRSAATVRNERGLSRIMLRMEEVDRALPARRATLSMVEAGRLIGVQYRHLHIWARKNLFETSMSPERGARGRRVTAEEWDRFRRTYMTGGELTEVFGQRENFWLSRHLKHQGIDPVSGPGVDEGELALFRRTDCTPEVIAAVLNVQARPPGTAQEKHRNAFAKALVAANTVAAKWGVTFRRVNNRFTDEAGGRTLQVVSGRRPDLTGVFSFGVAQTTITRLRAIPNAWVALVPAQGETFLLVPFNKVPWRGATLEKGYITVRFDARGRPLEMADWAMDMP